MDPNDDIDRALMDGKRLTKAQEKRLEMRNADRLKKARERKIREGKIRDLLKKRVQDYGGEIRAVSWLGRSNAPDVLALFPAGGRYDEMTLSINCGQEMLHPWVECKRPGKDATEAQAREHERMRAAGCVVLMVRNEQELDAWLPPL